jgi:hypothetical protein
MTIVGPEAGETVPLASLPALTSANDGEGDNRNGNKKLNQWRWLASLFRR